MLGPGAPNLASQNPKSAFPDFLLRRQLLKCRLALGADLKKHQNDSQKELKGMKKAGKGCKKVGKRWKHAGKVPEKTGK